MNILSWFRRNVVCSAENARINSLLDSTLENAGVIAKQADEIRRLKGDWVIPDDLEESDRVYKGQRALHYNTYEDGEFVEEMSHYHLNPLEFSSQAKKQLKTALEIAKVTPFMDDFTKLLNILYFVQENTTYITDAEAHGYPEHFQFSHETYTIAQGDCEDSSILAYDMAKYAGIPLNKVYIVYGAIVKGTNYYGHAFIGYKDAVGTWFLGETTLDKATPMDIWKSRPEYRADKGLASWKTFYFKSSKQPWTTPNPKTSVGFTAPEEIDANSKLEREDKQDLLQEIWGKHGRKR